MNDIDYRVIYTKAPWSACPPGPGAIPHIIPPELAEVRQEMQERAVDKSPQGLARIDQTILGMQLWGAF